jgi:teichuronic acid exporter
VSIPRYSNKSRPAHEGRSGYAAGVIWSAVNAAAGVLLPFLLFIVFARHLEPEAVGVVVLVTALTEIIKAFGLPGLYEALLQQSGNQRGYHQTALAVLLVAGVALLIIYVGAIAVLRRLLPGLEPHEMLLDLVGLRIVFDLATIQPLAALAQSLSYRRLALRSIIANLGAGAVGVALVLHDQPLTGLVAYQLSQSLLAFLVTATGADALVWPHFDPARMAAMRREAIAASVVRLVAATNNSLDQILVAASINSLSLAYFNVAKRVETTFITAASSYSAILFQPLFSGQAPEARGAGLRRGLAVLGIVCGLPCVFFVANAQSVVMLAFGPRWLPAATVAAILAVSGFVRALGSVHGALLSVSGRNHQLMVVTAVSATSGIAIVLAGASFGLIAVAAGLAAKNAAVAAWMAALTREAIPDPIRAYARGILLPVAVMLAASLGGTALASHTVPLNGIAGDLVVLAVSGVATAAAGLACSGLVIIPRLCPRSWLTWHARSSVRTI